MCLGGLGDVVMMEMQMLRIVWSRVMASQVQKVGKLGIVYTQEW